MSRVKPPGDAPKHWRLRFVYQGSRDVQADLEYYKKTGGKLVWDFTDDATRVAAFDFGEGPLLLLASHRPAPGALLVYEVVDLAKQVRHLAQAGISPHGKPFEIPNGPCVLFADPSGNLFGLFEDVRPGALG